MNLRLVRPFLALSGIFTLAALTGTGCSSSGGSGDDGTGGSGAGSGGDGLITDGTGGNGNGTGAGGTKPNDCGGQAVDAQVTPANLLFVIDRSGSMDQEIEPNVTRWEAMIEALQGALDHVPPELSIGLQFFPGSEDPEEGCDVPSSTDALTLPVGPSVDNVPALRSILENAEANGNTPTAAALQLAYDYFTDGAGKDLEGGKYVLVALDGGPNCNTAVTCDAEKCTTNIEQSQQFVNTVCGGGNCCTTPPPTDSCLDEARTLAKVEQLAAAGITTLVVGIPGSDETVYMELLDQMAVAGGAPASNTSPKYYKVDDPDSLAQTLVSLTTQLITSCELHLEEVPPARNLVNVFIDNEVVPQAGDDGWEYDDATTPPTIVVKGETCAALESKGAQSVKVEFGCPTIIVR